MLPIILSAVDLDESGKNKFEKIYYKYRDRMLCYAVKILSNEADAEDVLQETFIKIAKNIKTIRDIEERETNSYLMVMLKNTAYDFLRKKAKCRETDIVLVNESSSDSLIEQYVSRTDYKKTVNVIKSLSSPYAEVLYLHYVRDLSVKQTAHLLERKSDTVKMQLVRGKRILLKKLSEAEYD